MTEHTLSRRKLLEVAGLGPAPAFGPRALSAAPAALTPAAPARSAATPGRDQTGRLIMGEDAGTTAMPDPYPLGQMPGWAVAARGTLFNAVCRGGKLED